MAGRPRDFFFTEIADRFACSAAATRLTTENKATSTEAKLSFFAVTGSYNSVGQVRLEKQKTTGALRETA